MYLEKQVKRAHNNKNDYLLIYFWG